MVAKITTGKSIRGMLHYNENKVSAGEARLILASGFAGDIEGMNFNQKLQRFQHLTELKPNVKTNAVHISLNFHSSEKLSNQTLQQIAGSYLEKLGFGDQPYLVYRHDDAAHQHLHITTTNINAQGERMDLHDIGRKLSEPARKELEIEFGLVKAEDSNQEKQQAAIKPADLEKARYGRLPTKRAISNVVTAVSRDYRFTSLAEYNAVLKCFNVAAFRGEEDSAMFEKKGLMYSLLDHNGKQIGVPIKSSAFYCKPTLRNLEHKLEANAEKRKEFRDILKQQIDGVLTEAGGLNRSGFVTACKRLGIEVIYRKSAEGQVFGITFVDHRNKVVFNGSDLGKAYAAKTLTSQLGSNIQNNAAAGNVKVRNEKPGNPQNNQIAAMPRLAKTIHLTLPEFTRPAPEEGIKIPKRRKKRRKKQIISQEINL